MSRTSLRKEQKKFERDGLIDGKIADQILRIVLADQLVSRTERRFIKDLLLKHQCDEAATHKFIDVLLRPVHGTLAQSSRSH